MLSNRKFLIAFSAASVLILGGCETTSIYPSAAYAPTAQNARAIKRLQTSDIAVSKVRVVKELDADCAGALIPIGAPGATNAGEAFAAYWKDAFTQDLKNAGVLNESQPKVKLYALFDKVKIQGELNDLAWKMKVEIFSSNGHSMREEIVYRVPSEGVRNMREGCTRISEDLNKAVAWSILKITSNPNFAELTAPGLSWEPSMKGESIKDLFFSDDSDKWKNK